MSTERPSAAARDWPAEAADRIVDTVGQVRAKTTRPALLGARYLVYGLVLGMVGLAVLVLVLITLFKVTDFLPGDVYWAYLVWGALFTLVGIVLWSKRTAS